MCSAKVIQVQFICHTSVFNKTVMATLFLDNFLMPNITPYDCKGDSIAHVEVISREGKEEYV